MNAPDSPDLLSSQLTRAVTLVTKQDQVVWTIFGIFWAANALLVVALFTTGALPKPVVGLVVSAVGIGLSVLWTLVQGRALKFLGFYEKVMADLEERLLREGGREGEREFALSRHLNPCSFNAAKGVNVSTRRVIIRSGIASIALWALAMAWFLCQSW